MTYTVQDTTMTALGDAIRKQTEFYIETTERPIEPDFVLRGNTADFETYDMYYYGIAYHFIKLDLEELLGNKFPYTKYFYINYKLKSNDGTPIRMDGSIAYSGIQTGALQEVFYYSSISEVESISIKPVGNTYDTYGLYFVITRQIKDEATNTFNDYSYEIEFRACPQDTTYYLTLNTYTPAEMIDAINGLSIIPNKALHLSGSWNNKFCSNGWNWFIEAVGDKITTSNITGLRQAFDNSTELREIPFVINVDGNSVDASYLFQNCYYLKTIPMIKNLRVLSGYLSYAFNGCYRVRYFPDGFGDDWDFTALNNYAYGGANYLFQNCYSLRKAPQALVSNSHNKATSSYSSSYYYTFYGCHSLDEIIGFGVSTATLTSNMFTATFANCGRLANLTFAVNEDGTPKTANWKNQTISLNTGVGSGDPLYITGYNSGITEDKYVADDATYQALKNDPDWYTNKWDYSRYNHDSAVNTINSLPDCSSSGGTNTIKFMGQSGALTDGGAINTLTEEEIAVATVKGWTVSFV